MAKVGVHDGGKNRSVRPERELDRKDNAARQKQDDERATLLEKMRAKTQGDS